jgi:hypothetical protein
MQKISTLFQLKIASYKRPGYEIVPTSALPVSGHPKQPDHCRRGCDKITERSDKSARPRWVLKAARIDNPSIGEHHPDCSPAKAVSQTEIKKGDNRKDPDHNRSSLNTRKAPV